MMSPTEQYNAVRCVFATVLGVLLGSIYYQTGSIQNSANDIMSEWHAQTWLPYLYCLVYLVILLCLICTPIALLIMFNFSNLT